MNPHLLKKLFPNASASVLAANSSDYGTGQPDAQVLGSVRHPKPKPDPKTALEGVAARKEEGLRDRSRRVKIRITGHRCSPLDPDNFAGSTKDIIDALRSARLIPGDEFWQIVLETDQVKVATKKEEGTEVIITYP